MLFAVKPETDFQGFFKIITGLFKVLQAPPGLAQVAVKCYQVRVAAFMGLKVDCQCLFKILPGRGYFSSL